MSQKTPTKHDTLLCTYKDCQTPQGEDGEYCETHSRPCGGTPHGKPCENHIAQGDLCQNCIDDIPF